MLKKTIFFLSICLTSIFNAQTTNMIIGKVIEFETKEPMQFVNVILFNQTDSSQIAGCVTDVDGNFQLGEVTKGKYYIKTSFIGYEDSETNMFLHNGKTDIGLISIKNSPVILNQVNITGERSVLLSTLDKRVYTVGKDVMSESGSVSDILQHIPSLTVDIDGTISLRGTSNITFLLNGRPSALLRRSATTALQQIPANTIERIEIITNPSAKYKPDGTGGIINIIPKTDSENGLNGQVHANIGNEKRFNTGINVNYGGEAFSTFAGYTLRHSGRTLVRSDERTTKNPNDGQILDIYNSKGESVSNPWAHIVNAGINYDINNSDQIEISGNYFLQNTKQDYYSDISIVDKQFQPLSALSLERTNKEYESEGEGSALLEHKFDEEGDHNLTLEINYSAVDEKEDQIYKEIYSFPDKTINLDYNIIKKTENQIEIKSEYVLPINDESEFQAGYVGELRSSDIYYNRNLNPNRFLFDQDVHALYAIYNKSIENFSFQFGLRGEQAGINSHLVEPNDTVIDNSYFRLYPTIHLAYELAENQNVKLSYSKRINRPDADELNPFLEYSDPYNAEMGNPNLKPEQIYSLELTYLYIGESITFTPTLYYRYKYDAFTQTQISIPGNIILSTVENLADQKSAGLEVILSGKVFDWWELDLSSDFFYNQIDASNLGYGNKKDVISTTAKLNSFYKITPSTFFQLNFFYHSPRITPQGTREQRFYLNAGMKQQFFDKRIDLTLTVSDLFGLYKSRWHIDTPELLQLTNRNRKEPVFYFGINWRFGSDGKKDTGKLDLDGEVL
jgi:outer membrane receptor protein involved in Fe transport